MTTSHAGAAGNPTTISLSADNAGLTIGNTTPAYSSLGSHTAVGTLVAWGGNVALNQAGSWVNSSFPSNGYCQFSAMYQLTNTGSAPATFTQFFTDGPSPTSPIAYGTYTLAAGQEATFNVYLYLKAGSYPISLQVDAGSLQTPTSNAYTLGKVNVTMTGDCGAVPVTPPPPPPPPTPKADLVSKKGITIGGSIGGAGGKSSSWGGVIQLKASDAFLTSNGKCAFNVAYDISNTGAAPASGFVDQVFTGTQLISQQSALSLKAGENKLIYTQAYLAPGTQVVRLMVDATNVVPETNETNNSTQVYVNLVGPCAPPSTDKGDNNGGSSTSKPSTTGSGGSTGGSSGSTTKSNQK